MRLLRIACWTMPLLFVITFHGSGHNVPFAVRITSPEYPTLAQMARITGTVVLRVRLNSDGKVADVKALSGHGLLARAAEQNIRLWRFAAVGPASSKVSAESNFTYVFKLKGVYYNSDPAAELTYEYPDRVTVTSKAPLVQS